MGKLYRRHATGNWYGDYTTPEGRRVQGSLRTKDKTVAKERLRLAELGATPNSRGKKVRLMTAIDGMITAMHDRSSSTVEMYQEKGRRLLKTLGDPFVTDITYEMLNRYIKRRLSAEVGHGNAAPHTISKELITVRRALKHAIRTKALHEMPPWPEFAPDYTPKTTWLTVPQFDLFVAKVAEGRRLWVSLAALGGMRSSEVERLTWAMVRFDANRIDVPGSKTELSRRSVPIAPALHHRLAAVPMAKRTGLVVTSWTNVRRALHAAADAAKVPRVSPNDLRRTFASWMVQAGAPLLTVATLLGHSSTRMLEKVYGRLSDDNLEDAIGMLPRGQGVTDGVTEQVAFLVVPDNQVDEKDPVIE